MRISSPIKRWLTAAFGLVLLLARGTPAFAQESLVFEVDKVGDVEKWGRRESACSATVASDCTLRDAIENANHWWIPVTITFAPGLQNIALTHGSLDIYGGNVTIQGPGQQLSISGSDSSRIFVITETANVAISNVTLTAGSGVDDFNQWVDGGAVNNAGNLTLTGVSITNSHANNGGAIANTGTLTLTGVSITNSQADDRGGAVANIGTLAIYGGSFSGNRALTVGGAIANFYAIDDTGDLTPGNATVIGASIAANEASAGGGIFNSRMLAIRDSEVVGNVAIFGGGIINSGESIFFGYGNSGEFLSVDRCLIALNQASDSGGGVYTNFGTTSIRSSTFSLNTAAQNGGGLYSVPTDAFFGPTVTSTIVQSTFVANSAAAGGGIRMSAGAPVTLKNSIVAASEGGDCIGAISGVGINLDTSDPTVNMIGTCPAAIHSTIPALRIQQSPTNNGGPTRSLALLATSSAIDRVTDCTDSDGTTPLTIDQTGYARPDGTACDVGAFEFPWSSNLDHDADGVLNADDNCPSHPNPVQFDLDHDGFGDECDDDRDGDGVANDNDASPESDRQCSDTDHDSCDDCASGTFNPADDGLDNDGDGVCNAADNDLDTDGDGIQDLVDAFPYDRNACGDSDQDSCDDCAVLGGKDASNDGPDSDGDGVCNAGETDDDNDGVPDAADNCPVTANADQADLNSNGLGDACDTALYANIKVIAANLRNVSATGTFVSMADEYVTDDRRPITLPFAFRFFGHEYSSLRISSNGFITFADSAETGCCEGPDYPSAGGPNNLIAGWWEDLSVPYAEGLTGQVRYQTLGVAPARQFVIGFYGVRHAHPTRDFTVTFEIILHEGGAIELQYGNIIDDGDGVAASAGFENTDGRVGRAIGVGQQNLADFLANKGFLFTPAFPAAVLDSDGDGADDNADACPADPAKTAPGVCGCGAADADGDGDGLASCVDADDDNDGIPDAIDRNKTTGADESSVASSDYRKDAATFGSVTRNGWTVALVDGANGITATISGAGSSPALISACDGRAKRIVLSAANEAAGWHCEGSSIVVNAIAALPRIEVEKGGYCVGPSCGWTVVGKLFAGQRVTTGSPWTNGAAGALPVAIVDPNGAEAGSFTLDANESVDVELVTGPNGDPNAQVTVLAGSVAVSAFGQSETLNESSGTTTFGADTEAPAITCAVPDGAWHSDNVSLACTASDAGGSGLANAADASFSLSTSVPAGTADANAFTGSRTVCDAAGNCATQPAIGGNKIDRRSVSMTCATDAPSLWPANHKLVAVNVSVTINGVVSTSGVTLKSVTSSEPDNGLGDGDTAGDIQGWTIGGADVSGQLRAERSGKGAGRTYTLTYEGRNAAGTTASCTATVVVPQNGNKK